MKEIRTTAVALATTGRAALRRRPHRTNWQALVTIAGLAMLLLLRDTRPIATQVLADAYWQVTAYVAFTLLVLHGLQARLSSQGHFTSSLQKSGFKQVLFAASLGMLPGCGGAIVVMTQFVKGQLSFGSVVAVLTATMGDAAFLLLAAEPIAGAKILTISLAAGIVTGLCVDALHGSDYLRPISDGDPEPIGSTHEPAEASKRVSYQGLFWQIAFLPTLLVAILVSFQVDPDVFFGVNTGTFQHVGAALAVTALALWALSTRRNYDDCVVSPPTMDRGSVFQLVAKETHYITSWVVFGFLCFEFAMLAMAFDPTTSTPVASWTIIPAAIAVGWIPGCGPQILTTSLYISGHLPFSAQLGNAISNDGDALFPAIALAPRAALMATVYSTLPAVVAAYSYAFLFEG